MSQNPAARTILWEHHLSELLTFNAFDAVELGQPLVQKREVGINDIAYRKIFVDQRRHERFGLAKHRGT